ncbi:MAG: aldose 1-epimerase family protein [Bacteroidota bacterium]|jgi:galactose mutarotase-like enzyme
MINLENEYLSVKFSPLGAEMKSVFSKSFNLEYIWNANPKYWNRSAPLLFPIVGELKNNSFNHKDKTYELPRHGFIRNKDFKIIDQAENLIEFEFCANSETLTIFPFHFSLRVKYEIQENEIKSLYTVFNPGAEEMLYSFGCHPGFMLHDSMENYVLEFEKEESTQRYFVDKGLISNRTENFKTEASTFQLKKDYFKTDALVFKELSSKKIKLQNLTTGRAVELSSDEKFRYFGIWTQPDCEEFICLEPWAGIADAQNFSGELAEKEGIRILPPYAAETFSLNYSFF